MSNARAQAVGGRLLTGPYLVLLSLSALAFVLIIWRFAAGLGRVTALSDGYPWGLWIAFDVVTGTALACGGYVLAIVVYIFNKGKYHPLVRPAILTSALGYSIAALSVMIDIGRPWNAWKLPIFIWRWNANSALLEVALCIMAYCVVLYIELVPAVLEKYEGHPSMLGRLAGKLLPIFDKALVFILALGMVLPTMHQSSLGTLIMLTGPRLHPLWFSPLLPLIFLVDCIVLGFAVIVFEATFSSRAFNRKPETAMLRTLAKLSAWVGLAFVVIRFTDLAVRGSLGYAFVFDTYSMVFWLETLLFIAPLVMLYSEKQEYALGNIFRQAMLLLFAGSIYRFNTYLIAFNPGPGWHYFPSVQEIFITVGLVALELAVYIAVVKTFPIVGGQAPVTARR
jgi:Ni/Fe-hydrogenase subunit HybB-like protein